MEEVNVTKDRAKLLCKGQNIAIKLLNTENSGVKIAAMNLKKDMENICDCQVDMFMEDNLKTNSDNANPHLDSINITEIVIGTIDNIKMQLEKENINISNLWEITEKKRWEAYIHQVNKGVLYIVGSDRRGTIFGIYELSEMLGVSPWYFWGDVPTKKKEEFLLPVNYFKLDYPSVPYRGIFLNDEEELEAWAKLHTTDDTIGPETYERIFELLLRLKGNYIWPAMHVNYFNENPENGLLASKMGVIVGTSHCDMLLRSNQNEWKPWLEKKGYTDVKYDYSIAGRNREILKEYWQESVEQNKEYDVCYTVGMRGIHDYGFLTEKIDQESGLSKEEKQQKRVKLLEEVIADQRKILKEVLGEEKGRNALQLFIPYKEVLTLYDKHMEVPDDITLMWVDDNFGYMRRYPNEQEKMRSGGNGVYFHASYWAHPGMSYLFFNSIPLAHTGNELKKCYESGIQKMWVLNIGALKPLEIDMEFFIKYGWDCGKPEKENLYDEDIYLQNWVEKNFTSQFASEIAQIYNRTMQLTNVCKLEHMKSDKFSQTVLGDEAYQRLLRLQEYYGRMNEIYQMLPTEEKDAFFEMILMKIHASYFVNMSFYYADRSRLNFARGAMQAADDCLQKSKEYDDKKRRMLYRYNKIIQDGKWDKIVTPESFSPPPMALYPAGKCALVIGDKPKLGVDFLQKEIIFEEFGEKRYGIDMFNMGCGKAEFMIQCPEWLLCSTTQGEVAKEKKIKLSLSTDVSLYDQGKQGKISVIGQQGEYYECAVKVLPFGARDRKRENVWQEADGYVFISPDKYQRCGNGNHLSKWRVIPHIGRGTGNAVEAYGKGGEVIENNPYLEYEIAVHSEGCFVLEIYRFLTLNSTGKIRFAISVDKNSPMIVESAITDEWRDGWEEAVMNDGEKIHIKLPYMTAGYHNMRLYMIDQYVTISKLVIYTKEILVSNMGPSPSKDRAEQCDSAGTKPHAVLQLDVDELSDVIYQDTPTHIPLLPMLYADSMFWTINRLYIKSDEKERHNTGEKKYQCDEQGRKNVFQEMPTEVFGEEEGHIQINAEYALLDSCNAYRTPDTDTGKIYWTHTQSESYDGTGIAMMIENRNMYWEKSEDAPALHYRIEVAHEGKYHIWILVKFDDHRSDACVFALDGMMQKEEEQFSKGHLFTYSMKQRWNWQHISDMELTQGIHTFSIYGKKSGLRIDKIYMTKDNELPPAD